jgi:hypothetical protein
MFLIPPRPFILGEANIALVHRSQYWVRTIPTGAPWELKYFLVNYRRTVAGGAQTTPDLTYILFDSGGQSFQVDPVLLPMVTTPAGGARLDATNPIGMKYPGGSSLKVLIQGQDGAGPAAVSLTFFGIRGAERFGRDG